MITLPLAPVDAWFLTRHPHPDMKFHTRELATGIPSSTRLAEHIGTIASNVRTWRSRGGIPLDAADQVAVACGRHPCEFWPYYDEIEPWWTTPPWLRKARTRAVLESWRQRLDCDGVAGDHARRMFNTDEGDSAA